jgi:hypothetical protein
MTKQTINVGTSPNDRRGDSLRAAFQKVNANFTELYTSLGLDVAPLNLGAFEFTGSTLSTTDSSSITIDQATTITSNLSVGGDIVPQTANGGDLGSSTLPWRSLYVSNNTIYIGGTAVGIDANGQLTVSGSQVNAPSSTLVNGAYTVSLGSNGNLETPGIVSAAGLRTSETKIALGSNAGQTSQGSGSVAVGAFAGQTSQGPLSVAIGYGAGAATQGSISVAIGNLAGSTTQGGLSVAVGSGAGQVNQGYEAVAVGSTAGFTDQGTWSVAIGSYAGAFSQGEDAIAIGRFAGQTDQPDNTIILNASGSAVDGVAAQTNSFYVAPIRNIGGTSGVLQYNAATKEVSYSSDITSEGNINIEVNLTDSTKYIWQFGEDGALTLPPGGTILTSSGLPFVYGITSINSSVAIGVYNDASGDYQYGTLSYDYAVNGITSGGFSIEYSRPLVGGNVDIHVGNTIVNGDLTLSGDIKSDGNINIDINLADSTLRRWQFGEDGELTLPEDAVVKTISGNLTIQGQSYVFIDSATNGQIEIGRSSGVGAVSLGNKSNGTNVVVDDLFVANGVYEFFSSLADATGVVTHNCANGHLFYHTSPDTNWTVNLTNLLDTWNRATSVTIIIAQGATGYYPSAVQIAGVAQTLNWQGNVTPTPSTNRTDVVRFSIINNSGTYTVLGQLTGF